MKNKFTIIAALAVALQFSAQSWVSQTSNFPNDATYPLVINAKGENVAWAFGADGTTNNIEYRTFTKTSDGGTTWVGGAMNGVPASVAISDIAAGDGNTAWVITYPVSGAGGVYKTTDGGANWNKQASATFGDAASFANVIYFWDMNNGIALGDPITSTGNRLETYITSDGGTNWTSIPGPDTNPGEYGYVHNKTVVGNTIWHGSNQGRIFRSNDRGATWLPTIQSPLSDFGGAGEFGYMTLKDVNTAWISSSLGILYKTTDGGANFVDVPAQSGIFYPTSLLYIPGTDQTLVCGGGSTTYGRGSSISFDGGDNWIEITNTNDDVGITALAGNSPSSVYGGTFYDSTTGGGMNKLVGVLATSEAKAQKGVTIAPNPTYGDLNISTVLNIKSIEILDMNGRVIKTFGSESKKLNLSTLKSGVYAVKVNTADGKSQITKFIKK